MLLLVLSLACDRLVLRFLRAMTLGDELGLATSYRRRSEELPQATLGKSDVRQQTEAAGPGAP
jgi:hypothetical protein